MLLSEQLFESGLEIYKKKVGQENTLSTKKASTKKSTRSRKNDNDQENTLSTKKKRFLNKEKYQSIWLSTTYNNLSIRPIKTT